MYHRALLRWEVGRVRLEAFSAIVYPRLGQGGNCRELTLTHVAYLQIQGLPLTPAHGLKLALD